MRDASGSLAGPGGIHVCHLIKGLGRGGAEALLPQTIRAGNGKVRYSVGYFLPWKDAFVPELERCGAEVHCFGARSNVQLFTSIPAVARWLSSQEADLVHAHLPLAGVVARLAGRLARVPVVYTEHNLLERYHPWTRRANLATWPLQERVITVSAEVADSVARHAGGRVPVQVVRNGIEVAAYQASSEERGRVRRELGIPETALVVGTVAVFRTQKRLDLWLEVAARLAHGFPEMRFLLVGDGPLAPELRDLCDRLGLAERVIFTGLQEEVPPFLAAMDVYLISSEFEGLPLALLEAMAAGLPVVATSVGGIPEVIEHGRSGILTPPGDPRALEEAVAELAGDPRRRHALGEAARERVAAKFGVDRMAAELETIYSEVLAR